MERAQPGAQRSIARNIEFGEAVGQYSDGWIVPAGSPTLSAQRSDVDETQFGEFNAAYSATSLDVDIDPSEAYVDGWIATDTVTTITLAASTADQTVVLGWNPDAIYDDQVHAQRKDADELYIALESNVPNDVPYTPIWRFDTDGSGVTNAEDLRQIGNPFSGEFAESPHGDDAHTEDYAKNPHGDGAHTEDYAKNPHDNSAHSKDFLTDADLGLSTLSVSKINSTDVVGSDINGTEYQNTTGNLLYVIVELNSGNPDARIEVYSDKDGDGNPDYSDNFWIEQQGGEHYDNGMTLTTLIPDNYYYSVEYDSGDVGFDRKVELELGISFN